MNGPSSKAIHAFDGAMTSINAPDATRYVPQEEMRRMEARALIGRHQRGERLTPDQATKVNRASAGRQTTCEALIMVVSDATKTLMVRVMLRVENEICRKLSNNEMDLDHLRSRSLGQSPRASAALMPGGEISKAA
ncbi:hypothetical protein [Mesorhizobium sp. L103C119B0]|uniref:hypothetical protein n=1 Tax=Mesorhizobium sp. L103C119B0 TaxID=1287085 RepID=UPI000406E5A3|nr:hypothetical protein [Mesorhizobium sp. L103C119B0]